MKRNIVRNALIAKLAALALSALCIMQTQIRAQGITGYIVIFPSAGLAPGQTLRLTLFNPAGEPVRAQARIHHSGGIVVALADGSVRAGAFHSFDFKRSDIPLPGEAGTGRIQLSASFLIRMSEPEKKIDKLSVSMETISISDGSSSTVFFGEIPPSRAGGNGNDILKPGFGNNVMVGIVPGQTMRVTLSYVPSRFALAETGSFEKSNPISARVKVFDESGNLAAQSADLIIPPGEFRSLDFDRFALPTSGEPGTNRAQARFEVVVSGAHNAPRSQDVIITDLVSFEVIDNNTGKTEVLSGQQCLVFFLGGMPGN